MSNSIQITRIKADHNISLLHAQYLFLQQEQLMAKVYLVNGICLTSPILAFDNDFLLLKEHNSGGFNLINSEAVATVVVMDIPAKHEVSSPTMSIKDVVLGYLSNKQVSIFLLNGIKLDGYIKASDKDGILLERDRQIQVVSWKSLSTMSEFIQKERHQNYR